MRVNKVVARPCRPREIFLAMFLVCIYVIFDDHPQTRPFMVIVAVMCVLIVHFTYVHVLDIWLSIIQYPSIVNVTGFQNH